MDKEATKGWRSRVNPLVAAIPAVLMKEKEHAGRLRPRWVSMEGIPPGTDDRVSERGSGSVSGETSDRFTVFTERSVSFSMHTTW